ncbi:hypothetical protein BDV3_000531 [Batrachochytrium dendrobatidis]|uniref:Uncharacterized protein n=1 Tax=Batrachochytrium dendrobatidis (strain JEL423) TaxID=403673 RepID=A0A177WCU9_BATDL|nr:hypothetical protein BDEG_21565 [Batrachochytrium dendrobatidis JEL423]
MSNQKSMINGARSDDTSRTPLKNNAGIPIFLNHFILPTPPTPSRNPKASKSNHRRKVSSDAKSHQSNPNYSHMLCDNPARIIHTPYPSPTVNSKKMSGIITKKSNFMCQSPSKKLIGAFNHLPDKSLTNQISSKSVSQFKWGEFPNRSEYDSESKNRNVSIPFWDCFGNKADVTADSTLSKDVLDLSNRMDVLDKGSSSTSESLTTLVSKLDSYNDSLAGHMQSVTKKIDAHIAECLDSNELASSDISLKLDSIQETITLLAQSNFSSSSILEEGQRRNKRKIEQVQQQMDTIEDHVGKSDQLIQTLSTRIQELELERQHRSKRICTTAKCVLISAAVGAFSGIAAAAGVIMSSEY